MAVSLIQHTSKDASSATSTTISFAAPTTAGNFIVVGIRVGGTSTVTTSTGVQDDHSGGSNNYQAGPSDQGSDIAVTLATFGKTYLLSSANAGACQTLTISLTGGAATMRICIAEFSGVATASPLDKTAGQHTNPGVAITSGNTATTTQASELLIGFSANNAAGTYTHGTSQAYTITDSAPAGASARVAMEWVTVSSTGAYAGDWTNATSTDYVNLIATYKAAAAATDTDPPFGPLAISQPSQRYAPEIMSV